ncbi:MAG: cupin domain-containing protein [Myxococcales bacterium]|nr:cupin domain-containing protein [Myxococcales bacterium]
MIVRTPTPWGAQTLWAATDRYAAKILEIAAGHRTSLQHHVHKTETLLVLDGELVAEVGGRTLVLGPGERLHLPAGTRHRLGSRVGVRLVEVSTPELDDVVRHEDDYGRDVPPSPVGPALRLEG